MIEVKESQTASFLKGKIIDTLLSFGVTIEQIFSITSDNGANMLAAVWLLKSELEQTLLADLDEDDDDTEQLDLTDELCTEFNERLNLIRCAVHSLQLAILDVVKKSNESVKKVTDVAKKCKLTRYKTHFEFRNAHYPPVWCQTRWGGIFKMLESFKIQKEFFVELSGQFPELDLSCSWEFIEKYVDAFKPVYICTKNMQATHVSLPDFYMGWLLAISEVQKIENNTFVPELVEALTNRLNNLRDSRAFKMALYLDPRFNYLGSKIFTGDEKDQVQEYLVDTWNRISELDPCPSSSRTTEPVTETRNDDFDKFLTDLFGGSAPAESSSDRSTFLQQLKALEVEPRQNHGYDSFQHWLNRSQTHPELYRVAMVVLAVPSNQVSVERAFSAFGLVLSNRRTGLAEDTLANILLVKLNRELFDKVMPNLYNWKEPETF
ncbi:uncharacterized protein LOC131676274 [Topomyia yanbarensis]|uniref:uncharacterized protein LOC131676274 n=1 Tax=Topomyia yanbarensis TaxID=2498891 RepID=UPI00273AA075|nr:uncharacterized protein LOC131676274 [Topomyia yanbarensis]